MATDETKKARRLRKPETVRERADKASQSNGNSKRRVIKRTAGTAFRPIRAIGRFIAKILRPFRFLLWPFKTKVGRAIGRFLTAVLFLRYFRNSYREVRTVSWPNRRQTINLTFAVFVFALGFGLFISLVDYGLDKVFKHLLLK